MQHFVYLDNHTVTRPCPEAVAVLIPFLNEKWGVPHAPHRMGQEVAVIAESAAQQIASVLGLGEGDHLVFASSGAEAIERIFLSHYTYRTRTTGKNHFLTATVEGAATLLAIKRLEEWGCVGKMLPVNQAGQLLPDTLEAAIKPRASLISVSWAHPVTGVLQPIADIARICQEKEVALHVDASLVIGKLAIEFRGSGIAYLSVDGSLVHAPQGTAVIAVQTTMSDEPHRPGLSGLDGGRISALAIALEKSREWADHVCTETARLRDRWEKDVQSALPEALVLFQDVERLPNVSVIAFPGMHSELLLYKLHRRGVYASFGGGPMQTLSHVLTSCGWEKPIAYSALSFALSYETSQDEMDRAADILVRAVQDVKQVGGG